MITLWRLFMAAGILFDIWFAYAMHQAPKSQHLTFLLIAMVYTFVWLMAGCWLLNRIYKDNES